MVVQPVPCEQGLHAPALQTPPAHAVPFDLLLPSTHTADPDVQSTTPFLHAALGFVLHAAPALQALQNPLLQTPLPPPQLVPFALLLASAQTGAPVVQLIVPFLQSEVGFVVHAVPALHALHAPLRQAPPGQVVPFALFVPSVHTAEPVEQLIAPFLHVLPGFVVHPAPCVQGLHVPALHTPPAHAVPAVFAAPSTQTGAPVLHVVVPL